MNFAEIDEKFANEAIRFYKSKKKSNIYDESFIDWLLVLYAEKYAKTDLTEVELLVKIFNEFSLTYDKIPLKYKKIINTLKFEDNFEHLEFSLQRGYMPTFITNSIKYMFKQYPNRIKNDYPNVFKLLNNET